jgi:hypothetical protein
MIDPVRMEVSRSFKFFSFAGATGEERWKNAASDFRHNLESLSQVRRLPPSFLALHGVLVKSTLAGMHFQVSSLNSVGRIDLRGSWWTLRSPCMDQCRRPAYDHAEGTTPQPS